MSRPVTRRPARGLRVALLVLALLAPACADREDDGGDLPPLLDAQSHEPFFPIASGTHGGLACRACHDDSFQRFDCLGCHFHAREPTDAAHAAVDDYAYESAACLACHPRGAADAAPDHDRIFPIGEGSAHAGAGCAACHTDPRSRNVVTCTGTCHVEGDPDPTRDMVRVHADVGGYAHDSPLCLRCHPDAAATPVAAHDPVALLPPSPHDASKVSCLGCHPRLRDDKPFGADFETAECVSCHEHDEASAAADHLGGQLPGYRHDDASCRTCHPAATAEVVVDHPDFPIDAPPHDGEVASGCTACHANAQDVHDVTCTGACHVATDPDPARDMAKVHAAVAGYRHEDELCLRCHPDSQVLPLADHLPFRLDAESEHAATECLACHPQVRLDRTFAADFTKRDCTGCHDHRQEEMDREHLVERSVAGYAWSTPACEDCHPDGSRAAVDHTTTFPIGSGTAHEDAACETCHVDPERTELVSCTSGTCHPAAEAATQHPATRVGGYAWNTDACLRCHPESDRHDVSAHLPFVITSGDHRGESCLACHPDLRGDLPFPAAAFDAYSCTNACHDRREMDGKHDDEPGYAYVSTTCTRSGCHPDGRKHDD